MAKQSSNLGNASVNSGASQGEGLTPQENTPEVAEVDKSYLLPDWAPVAINTQEEADQYCVLMGLRSAIVTQDKTLFALENMDFALNHAIDRKLKIFTVNIIG